MPLVSHPLTDDQLHQVAAQLIIEDARIAADDLVGIGEQLGSVCTDLGIRDGLGIDFDPDTLVGDELDVLLAHIAHLIANANITVEWDGSPLSMFSEANPVEAEGATT
jgi:hypothetical protein